MKILTCAPYGVRGDGHFALYQALLRGVIELVYSLAI
jgi:hypothetical protein